MRVVRTCVVRMVYVPGQVQDSTVPNISVQGVKKLGKRVRDSRAGTGTESSTRWYDGFHWWHRALPLKLKHVWATLQETDWSVHFRSPLSSRRRPTLYVVLSSIHSGTSDRRGPESELQAPSLSCRTAACTACEGDDGEGSYSQKRKVGQILCRRVIH